MIVIDTSALMTILLDEPKADSCASALETDEPLLISAGTLAEAMIVAQRRDRSRELEMLIEGLGAEIKPVTPNRRMAFRKLIAFGARAFILPD